jgi:predicted GNAT family N-acyltransferase
LADGIAKIGRVCVLQSHRGTGLGAQLIQAYYSSILFTNRALSPSVRTYR